MKPLPPFGKSFQPVPDSGIRVAFGPTAWAFAKCHPHFPMMVLPEDSEPSDFRWPSSNGPALIYERGTFNDKRLDTLARALMVAGSPSVVALREALNSDDPRVFYGRKGQKHAA